MLFPVVTTFEMAGTYKKWQWPLNCEWKPKIVPCLRHQMKRAQLECNHCYEAEQLPSNNSSNSWRMPTRRGMIEVGFLWWVNIAQVILVFLPFLC